MDQNEPVVIPETPPRRNGHAPASKNFKSHVQAYALKSPSSNGNGKLGSETVNKKRRADYASNSPESFRSSRDATVIDDDATDQDDPVPVVKKKRRLVRRADLLQENSAEAASTPQRPQEEAAAALERNITKMKDIFKDIHIDEARRLLLESDGNLENAVSNFLRSPEGKKKVQVIDSSPIPMRSKIKSPAPQLSAADSESESDSNNYVDSGSDDGYVPEKRSKKGEVSELIHESDDELESLSSSTVTFFSNATPQEIMDVTGCSSEQAEKVVQLRPFDAPEIFEEDETIEDATVRIITAKLQKCKTKGVTPKLIRTYQDMKLCYREVDMLIRKCERVGGRISGILNSWSGGGVDNDVEGESGTHLASINVKDTESTDIIRQQPDTVVLPLKSYQLVGINWLSLLYSKKLSGILADEMGLGKTCQVIGFLAHLRATKRKGPHLVVVPASTLENWMREFKKFCPSIPVRSYYGAQRGELREDIFDSLHQHGEERTYVVVTTYGMATGSKEDRVFLRKIQPKSMILDEGHLVKNMASARYHHLMRIQAPFRLLLTGTPLQNNLQELVALLSFVMPSMFVTEGTQETLSTIFKLKTTMTSTGGSVAEAGLLSKDRIERAKSMMQPFVLRRRKDMVLKDLPAKTHTISIVPMSQRQQVVYENAVVTSRQAKNETTSSKNDVTKINNLLIHLRKIADHPLLLREYYTDDKLRTMSRKIMREEQYMDANPTYIFEDMQVMSDFELHRLCKTFKSISSYALQNEEWMDAGKIAFLKSTLPDMIRNGDKILIFSMFTSVLDILEEVLTTLDLRHVRVDGQTKVGERQDIIDTFNEDKDISVFLLSTKAGGVGLNLTSANVVIIYNLDFNPHNDRQAEDRAHRVGQTHEVRVYRLVSKETIEEQILQCANTKLKLDSSVSNATDAVDDEEVTSNVMALLRAAWIDKEKGMTDTKKK